MAPRHSSHHLMASIGGRQHASLNAHSAAQNAHSLHIGHCILDYTPCFHVSQSPVRARVTMAVSLGSTVIGFACTSGRHRSVAASILFGNLYAGLGHKINFEFLCAGNWPGCKGTCSSCQASQEELDEDLWDQLAATYAMHGHARLP